MDDAWGVGVRILDIMELHGTVYMIELGACRRMQNVLLVLNRHVYVRDGMHSLSGINSF